MSALWAPKELLEDNIAVTYELEANGVVLFVDFRVGTVRDFGISHEDGLNMKVVINSNGLVFFSQPTIVQSACAMNIAYFPFDDQVCELTIGSWSMDSTLLGVQLWKGGKDLGFRQNKMWALLDISVKAIDKVYPVNENPFSTFLCIIKIRRKSLFYVVNFIVPPVTISLLSLLLFLIPPEVGKRMGKCMHTLCDRGSIFIPCTDLFFLLTLRPRYLKDRNAAAHSVDSDLF